jgi:hypothetical protein
MGERKLRADKDNANGPNLTKRRLAAYLGLIGLSVAGVIVATMAMHADETFPERQDVAVNRDGASGSEADGPTAHEHPETSRTTRGGDGDSNDPSWFEMDRVLPGPDVPPDEAVAALLPLAEAGRPDAMHALAMRLLECPRTILDDAAIRKNKTRLFYWYNGHEPSSDAEIAVVANWIEQAAQRRDECTHIDPALIATGLSWLEKSAIAGDTRAMLDYARWGLSDIPGREDILMNFEEIARRRDLAGGFLDNALAEGDCAALRLLAESYSGERGRMDWIHPPDARLAYLYAYADAQWRPQDESARLSADHASESLDLGQRMDVETRGAALSLRCDPADNP